MENSAGDGLPGQPSSFFGRLFAWLFSQKHFHVKLLSGTAAGVVAIIFFAAFFAVASYRNYTQEIARAHTVGVMRLSSVVLSDIALLETAHRAFILTGKESYLSEFEDRRAGVKRRVDELTELIVDSPGQRKRVLKVQDIVQRWLNTYAVPAVTAKEQKAATPVIPSNLGSSILDEARELLQALQNEEQIVLNGRMRDQEWAAQSTQILDVLPKLERSIVDMQKEKDGYLLTGENSFADTYKHAANSFLSFHGYLCVLVANDDLQTAALRDIRNSVETWMNTSATPQMEARRAGRDPAAAFDLNAGETQMRDIRDKMTAFEKQQLDVYQLRSAAATRQRVVTITALTILCVFAIVLLLGSNSYSWVLVRRQLRMLEGVETRIKSIIENILDGMITVDADGVICSMNPAAEKMFGCINNEMLGHKFTKLVPKAFTGEGSGEPAPCAWNDLAKRTGGTTLALGRTRRNATFSIEISLSEMIVDNQLLYVAMIRDVTERKRFEKEIAAEKESLAVTLRSIGDGVITTDVQGKIIMINKAGETLTGWDSKEAIGQPLKSVFNVVVDLSAQARQQRTGYRNEAHSILLTTPENATLKSRDGAERVIEQVASPIRDNKNEVAGVVLVFRDITERQRMEAERRKADAIEQLGLVAGGIAHDFNNLLTAIIGNISLASLILPANDEMSTRLNDAKNASMRARDLAQQLLTFARGGAPIKQTASIAKLIQDTVSFSLRGANSRSEFTLGENLWPAEIDPGQISQVIGNLAVNADQAMPNGGTLRVSAENFVYDPGLMDPIPDLMPGDYIRISIKDEGVGIPEEYLKRIFDPYFTTKAKGNGLGLATTYSIMKNHSGLITVSSKVHMGSTFTLYLPALRDHSVEVEQPVASAITPVIEGSGRVLIVDDEETIRDLVDFTLSHIGYHVTGAETALDGVNVYREKLEAGERFDCVILDLTLPGGMGGKEALKRLIEIDPTVNAIVSSGYAMDDTMSRYRDYGFRGCIAKPYEAAELGRVVHEVIQSSRVQLVEDFEGGRLATRVA